ncbi:hypothetical protein Ct61P_10362 [Colletotrichum tofieldiae]|nr:hypothetical protein Ct61P_10362 [Colletotrichum tofieldiae]
MLLYVMTAPLDEREEDKAPVRTRSRVRRMTPQERKNCGRSREDKKGPTFDKRSHAKDRHAKDRSIARSDSKRVGPRNEIMRYKDIHSQ